MDTKFYSECIMRSLDYIELQIATLAEGSVNKKRLHSQIHMQLVIRAKELFELSKEDFEKILEHIFKTELNKEISRKRTED